MTKKAFLTGVTGQDGSYLAELLLSKGYEVHAIMRRTSTFTSKRIDKIIDNKNLITYHGDLCDSSNLGRLLNSIKPDEVYNLGAQSHVAVSFEVPEYTADTSAIGTLRILDAIRDLGDHVRFYQASTSELYGGLPETAPQSENTPFYPKSPYGSAKLYAYWITVNYREAYGLHASNGILFNHESPRRGETFVTKKITKSVANIKKGRQTKLKLGNLDALRDWGHAKDYVTAMWLMLQQKDPHDYVIASGETYSVREFVTRAFKVVDIDIEWKGEGIEEIGVDQKSGRELVSVDQKYFRPAEVDLLWGDPSLAQNELGWTRTYSFNQLIEEMVEYDLNYDDYGWD
ncbi:GDP-mannose 4,6-dehydratase [Amylibacter sp.]|nr:GDP-mannose 4,6-dehydratase [Amylibacter sp.]